MKAKLILLCCLVLVLMACTLMDAALYRAPYPTATPQADRTDVPTEPEPTTTPTTPPKTCVVSATSLHLRSEGNADAVVRGYLARGDELVVVSGDDWLLVQTMDGSLAGYVKGAYCE